MQINFDPLSIILALTAGIIMSFITSLNLYLTGRITGWSGIFYGISSFDRTSLLWKSSVISGAITAGSLAWIIQNNYLKGNWYYILVDSPQNYTQNLDIYGWIISAFLVGIGTKLANGCTSGHGVCGLPRLSIRSFVAVITFMTIAICIATYRLYFPFFNTQVNVDAVYNQAIVNQIMLGLSIVLALWNFLYNSTTREKKLDTIISYFTGFIFGGALVMSGMTRRDKVLGFLRFSDGWDPSLAFVMLGAIIPNYFTFGTILKQVKPKYADHFEIPKNTKVDVSLILGAVIFGLGWGIGGICPGPGIVAMGIYTPQILITFMPFLIIGQKVGNYLQVMLNTSKVKSL